jgi:capsular exopolysaccharide synthesis family protein
LSYEIRPENFKGLSDYLDGRAEVAEIIHEIGIDGFSYITCGLKSANSAELLGSPNFSKLISVVRDMFDVVIIDTPAMCCAIDCAVVAPFADGVVIVIDPACANIKQTRFQIAQLKKVNARILGAVLNKIPRKDYKKYYRGYEYYKKYRTKA